MNDVPLIQKADINSINTSIIAIKKQLKQINEALGLIDIPNAPDLTPYVRKDEVADVVEADNMNPVTSNAVAEYTVDEVTSGNMHSVSSNAVYNVTKSEYIVENQYTNNNYGRYDLIKCGNIIELNIRFLSLSKSQSVTLLTIPEAYRPKREIRVFGNFGGGSLDYTQAVAFQVGSNGEVYVYAYSAFSGSHCNLHATWII